LDFVSDSMKIEGEKRTAADAQFIKNMKDMETVQGELNNNEEGMTNLINRQRIAMEDGNDLPMSLAERRSNTIVMNGLNSDEQSFGGYNLIQWDLMDRSTKAVSNADVEDAVATPFNLAENVKNEERALGIYKKPQEDKRFNGQAIGALVKKGSAALKLNVAELSGAEEQVEQEDYLMTQWDLDVHGKQNAFDNSEILTTIHDKLPESDFF